MSNFANSRGSQKPKSLKALKDIERRKKEFKSKRFNEPLKLFLERRYPEILA